MKIKLDRNLLLMIRQLNMDQLARDICEVQPMSAESAAFFTVRPLAWSLPDERGRSVFNQDDVTMLLIMGYKLTHGHNCCTGFGGKYRDPMPYWISPNEEYKHESCEHDWEVNFRQ